MFRAHVGDDDDIDEAAIVQLTAMIDEAKRVILGGTLAMAAAAFLCGVGWYQVSYGPAGLWFFAAAVAVAPLGILAQRIALRILVPRWISELVARGVQRTPLELAFLPHLRCPRALRWKP